MSRYCFIFLLLAATVSHAGDTEEVLGELGVRLGSFAKVWKSNYCNPDWSITVSSDRLKGMELFQNLSSSNMVEVTNSSDGDWTLGPGDKCRALYDYYYGETISGDLKSIAAFVEADKAYRAKYGISALDGWWLKMNESPSWNGTDSEAVKKEHKQWYRLREKGLIEITTEDSTFNGQPSTAYYGKLTKKGKKLRRRLCKEDGQGDARCGVDRSIR